VLKTQLVHSHARHPQSQGKVERFNQTLGRHLTKMLWNEVSEVQGYRWIDVLSSFVIAYNKAPHEAHKKSPYEAFFGFKMRGVYDTPGETTQAHDRPGETTEIDETLGETTQAHDRLGETTEIDDTLDETTQVHDTPGETTQIDDTLGGTTQIDDTLGETTQFDETSGIETQEEDIPHETITEITQENSGQVAYETHVMQVEKIRMEIVQNDELYRNKMVVRGSVHRRKLAFEPGEEVAIAPDHDTNQKTRKRKLEQVCSISGKVIGMCSNNRTVRVEVNDEVKTFAAKNLRKLRRAVVEE